MKRAMTIVVVGLVLVAASLSAADVKTIRRFDANSNNRIEREELMAYFKSRGATDAEASGAATDALTAFGCPLPCGRGISAPQAAGIVDEVFVPKIDEANTPASPCKFLSIKRTVADTVDPRSPENDFPAILSYKHDEHATDTSQWNVLGAVDIFSCIANRGTSQLKNVRIDTALGLDFDVDGSTPPEESTIELSAPVSYTWIAPDAGASVTKYVATVTPKFGTDRAFNREVYEVVGSFALQSRALARAGLRTFLPTFDKPSLILWWQPSVFAEWTDIADSAGNSDLAALRKRTARTGLRADVVIWPGGFDERLAFKFKGFERYGSGGSHSYTESSATYNLDDDGKIQFTAIYRHGRKPPDFSPKDQWLVGIGIKR